MQPWDIAGSFQGAELNRQKISQGDIDAAGQAAAGRAFMAMIPGAQPMPQQGSAPPNAMGMPQNPLQRLQSLFRPQLSAGAPSPQGDMAQAPMPGAQPMPGQQPQMAIPGGGMPAGQSPVAGGTLQLGSPNGIPSLTWQSVVQQVVKANPGVKDPRVIASAVTRFMPIMNQQSQMEWRQIGLQLREGQQGLREQQLRNQEEMDEWRRTHGDTMAGQGQQRIEQEQQRVQQGQERADLAKQREQRLAGSAKVREDQGYQRLELQKNALAARITQGNQRQMLGQWRAIVDAQHKRAQEIIQSGSAGGYAMDPDERKKLLAEEDQRYNDEIKNMKNNMQGNKGFDNRFAPGGENQPQQSPGIIKYDAQGNRVTQ